MCVEEGNRFGEGLNGTVVDAAVTTWSGGSSVVKGSKREAAQV